MLSRGANAAQLSCMSLNFIECLERFSNKVVKASLKLNH